MEKTKKINQEDFINRYEQISDEVSVDQLYRNFKEHHHADEKFKICKIIDLMDDMKPLNNLDLILHQLMKIYEKNTILKLNEKLIKRDQNK